jgi:hypothetical protein
MLFDTNSVAVKVIYDDEEVSTIALETKTESSIAFTIPGDTYSYYEVVVTLTYQDP